VCSGQRRKYANNFGGGGCVGNDCVGDRRRSRASPERVVIDIFSRRLSG